MDHLYKRSDVFDLVGLQSPDHVPFDVVGQLFVFGEQLLRPILPEHALSGPIGFHDRFGRIGLRYGDQLDLCRKTLLQFGDFIGDRHLLK